MTIEIAIVIAGIIGLALGLYASRDGIKERDERIHELEGQLAVKQNTLETHNATIGRLRKELDQLKAKRHGEVERDSIC